MKDGFIFLKLNERFYSNIKEIRTFECFNAILVMVATAGKGLSRSIAPLPNVQYKPIKKSKTCFTPFPSDTFWTLPNSKSLQVCFTFDENGGRFSTRI